MKYIKPINEFLNESTTDGSVEALIEVTKLSMKMGIFNDEILRDVQDNFVGGVEGSLKGELRKIPSDKKAEFNGYMEALMGPLRKAKTMAQFLSALASVSAAKNNILARMAVEAPMNESKIVNWLKDAYKQSSEWWQRNKSEIITTIIELLVQIVIEILFAVLRALLKSKSLEAPKFKFGGGKFGGGGAGGNW